jgi:signal transduction histidine kinase/DNA-binding response OmpR family regulator
MNNNRFIYLVLAAFLAGILLLIFIQYNYSRNVDQLTEGHHKMLRELKTVHMLRVVERDIIWVESRIRAAIATDDTSHIVRMDARIAGVEALLDSLIMMTADSDALSNIERLEYLAKQNLHAEQQLMHEFLRTGKMDDTSLISYTRTQKIAGEIGTLTRRLYDSREANMARLSNLISENSRKARSWGFVLVAVILASAAGLLWFILNRFRHQQLLIQQLDRSEKRVRESARVKENFMANMSHEIRTPLNAILGFTNLLKTRQLDSTSSGFVGAIQKAGENLLTIINDILDLSKIEAGMVRIEASPFSVRGLLHSIQTLFSEKVKEKGLALNAQISPAVPDTLIGDATRLTQILVNLISNALKFTEKGGIDIQIYNKESNQHNIQLGISITDTGIGIEEQKLQSIFDRFHQAENSITRKYGGTGLGLSIVKDLILLQGGDITVESEPGKGTTFRFFIPYNIASQQVPAPEAVNVSELRRAGHRFVKILVVDDNEMNRSLMEHLLSEWNLSFDMANNGNEALARLKQTDYDLVLMDIQMPEMDGYSATRKIRTELGLDVPVIAMTAHALAGEREKCLSSGMNEYISKPVNERELYELINRFANDLSGSKHETPGTLNEANDGYKYINLEYMKEISKGNRVFEKKATRQFMESLPSSLQHLETALHRKDLDSINRLAHDLKTTVSIMGLAERLSPILDALEYAQEITPALDTHIHTLKTISAHAIKEAEHFYSRN